MYKLLKGNNNNFLLCKTIDVSSERRTDEHIHEIHPNIIILISLLLKEVSLHKCIDYLKEIIPTHAHSQRSKTSSKHSRIYCYFLL